ncbi:MAG: SemiSWEET transporter [Nitrososphaera sp.]|nr:SemiSWEET transporter [Nitrososphaera sp.]
MMFQLLKEAVASDFLVSIIGIGAAVLTTSSFLPQIIKGYRSKKMEDVSPYLMSMFSTGTALWIVYGIYKSDPVIIGANAIASAFNVTLLYMKFAYDKRQKKMI